MATCRILNLARPVVQYTVAICELLTVATCEGSFGITTPRVSSLHTVVLALDVAAFALRQSRTWRDL